MKRLLSTLLGLAALAFLAVATPAWSQPVKRLDLKPNDIVQWLGRDGKTYLILNVFAHGDKLAAMPKEESNKLLLETGLVESALRFARAENAALKDFQLLIISLRDMSEYGSGGGWKQLAAGLAVRGADKVELKDLKLDGALPQPLPTVAFPYIEASKTVTSADVRFRMPEKLYLVVGQSQQFFYENLVVAKDLEDYQYVPTGNSIAFATHGRRGLTFLAKPTHVGEHDLHIKATDWEGRFIAEGKTKVVVTAANASWQPAPNEPARVFILGHSLPSMFYPGYVANFLAAPGNPKVAFVGGIKYWYGKMPDFEHNPDITTMRHQASPGYSFRSVLSLYSDDPPANPNMPARSPFMFKDGAGPAKFDMARYFRESLDSKPPHLVLLNIGDNDTFNFDPDKPDAAAEAVFKADANKLLNELRSIAPDATFGAIMPNTYNYSDRSFFVNYGAAYPRLRQVRNRMRYIELMTAVAQQRGDFEIIPSNFSVDSVDGMPFNSGTHFNALGARQFAGSVYAWVKRQFAVRAGKSHTASIPVTAPAVAAPAVVPVPAAAAPAAVAPTPIAIKATTPAPVAETVAPPTATIASDPAVAAPKPDWYQRMRQRVTNALSFN